VPALLCDRHEISLENKTLGVLTMVKMISPCEQSPLIDANPVPNPDRASAMFSIHVEQKSHQTLIRLGIV